jgi:hypothetical protein
MNIAGKKYEGTGEDVTLAQIGLSGGRKAVVFVIADTVGRFLQSQRQSKSK